MPRYEIISLPDGGGGRLVQSRGNHLESFIFHFSYFKKTPPFGRAMKFHLKKVSAMSALFNVINETSHSVML